MILFNTGYLSRGWPSLLAELVAVDDGTTASSFGGNDGGADGQGLVGSMSPFMPGRFMLVFIEDILTVWLLKSSFNFLITKSFVGKVVILFKGTSIQVKNGVRSFS